MKHLIYSIIAVLFLSCNQGKNQDESTDPEEDTLATRAIVQDGVFIHISEGYADPHRVLMPLKMALFMSQDKDVIVYMDTRAVEMLAKGAEDIEMEGFESAQTYLKQLLDKKVGIYACPTCLKVAGINESNLMAGIQVAQKDRFFDFTKGKIINLDY